MTNRSAAFLAAASALRRLGSQFRHDFAGVASVEFVILLPVILSMLSLITFGGQGFEINRKITMVVRTLTDLATQQSNLTNSAAVVSGNNIPAGAYTATQILNAAALVIAPYDSSQLSMVLSEISANGAGTGTVVWSQANANGTALTVGASVSVPANITTKGYFILGATTYNFTPLGIYFPTATFPVTDSLYLAPRTSTGGTYGIVCCS